MDVASPLPQSIHPVRGRNTAWTGHQSITTIRMLPSCAGEPIWFCAVGTREQTRGNIMSALVFHLDCKPLNIWLKLSWSEKWSFTRVITTTYNDRNHQLIWGQLWVFILAPDLFKGGGSSHKRAIMMLLPHFGELSCHPYLNKIDLSNTATTHYVVKKRANIDL